uniref:Uncharacterized protein n=1 Tax=Xiphophorus couchianus TaxID=32473 RepID=A0A3B5L3F5_9TELE
MTSLCVYSYAGTCTGTHPHTLTPTHAHTQMTPALPLFFLQRYLSSLIITISVISK